jgi:hypothetical protein
LRPPRRARRWIAAHTTFTDENLHELIAIVNPSPTLQGQALKWITAMEAGNQLVVLKAASPGYLRQLEAAIGLGRPVLLAGVGEVMDAALAPVLLQQTFKQVR